MRNYGGTRVIEYNEIISKALHNLCPNGWSLNGADFKSVSDPQPTQEELDAEVTKLQAEYDANQYQRDRKYPSIGDQLDMQYHDEIDGTTTWKDAVAKVKADNPKPE